MDTHTLTVLQYGEVLAKLALFAQSEPGKLLVSSQFPRLIDGEVGNECSLTTEGLRLIGLSPPDLGLVSDVSPAIDFLRVEGAVLEPAGLFSLFANQMAVRSTKNALRESDEDLPGLSSIADSMTGLPEWEQGVRKAIAETGEVLDTASRGLAAARKKHRLARENVVNRLERFIRGRSISRVIQEPYITTRNGRHVVPAKPEYHREFEGVVQDSSQSGQTLFVEPIFAVGLNNDVAQSENLVREEVQKVLTRLSDEARCHRDAMAANMKGLATMDLVLAKARFGSRLGWVLPELDEERTTLRQAMHPLLAMDPETNCVPVDISIGGEKTTLVITGPNTGGKTVTLKTLGLLTLMVQSGIPVPVAGDSRIRVFTRVFADIGDEQSLSQSLSTFSGHMKVIADLLREADERTLVLLDELGAGTDPQEGSAIGMALLETLQDRGACVVVTTHHNLLKDFAFRSFAAENASTLFDINTLKPVYKLRMGAAGKSYALEIAERLGLEARVVERAREIIGAGGTKVEDLLTRLGEEIDRRETARQKAEKAAGELESARIRQESRQEKYRDQIRDIREKARKDAGDILREIENRGREIIRDLSRKDRESARQSLQEGLKGIEEDIRRKAPLPAKSRKKSGTVNAGDDVRVVPLGVLGRIEALVSNRSEAEIISGGIRMRVPIKDLEPASEKGRAPAPSRKPAPVAYSGTREERAEINLLGKTVPEALDSVDRLIDRSLMGSLQTLRIVHGRGTGALKKAINEALRDDPRVFSCEPAPMNEGGEGVTVVKLKE